MSERMKKKEKSNDIISGPFFKTQVQWMDGGIVRLLVGHDDQDMDYTTRQVFWSPRTLSLMYAF